MLELRDRHAQLLRLIESIKTRRFYEDDIEYQLEMLNEMSNSDKSAVRSQIRRFLGHYFKWWHKPEMRTQSWYNIISQSADILMDTLSDSKSLLNFAENVWGEIYQSEVKRFKPQQGMDFDKSLVPDVTLDAIMQDSVIGYIVKESDLKTNPYYER